MTSNDAKHPPIAVAMSGGVDSSVAALLLKKAGNDVHALHMTNWDDDDAYCTAAEDLQDARRVCEIIDIPLHHVNFSEEYRDRVFTDFLQDYKSGRTPNPDVLCNREIKFGVLHEHASRLGVEKVATGHYARTQRVDGRAELRVAADDNKDQTYFLHAVRQEALGSTLFPLGDLTKAQVRAVARQHGLPTRDKKDSTGICFIGERPFKEFLNRYLPAEAGPMVDEHGIEIGQHQGAMYYTVGQRKGLGIGGMAGANQAPWYVAARDMEKNALIVVQGERHPLLLSNHLTARDPHWIAGTRPVEMSDGPQRLQARIRHRQPLQPCSVRLSPDLTLAVEFDRPQWAIAPGQYVVLYDGDVCIGGACIENTTAAASPL